MKQANPAPNKIRKQSSSGAQSQASRAAFANTRSLYFLFSILVFALLTFLAHRQSPRPDPFQPVQALSWDWWKYPIERNAFKRLPVITSNLNDVFALPNSEKVWAVGDEGIIVHSEDGGETWMQQEVDWEAMPDSQIIQILRERYERRSVLEGVLGRNQSKSLQVGEGFLSFVQTFQSAGSKEFVPSRWKTLLSFMSVYFVDENNGWIVGSTGTILCTKNGGQAWQWQASTTTHWLSSVHFVNAMTGYAISYGLILSTRDGGQTWVQYSNASSEDLEFLYFFDANTGWAVGAGGSILATQDGGHSWLKQKNATYVSLNSVHFANVNTGWAVGYGGTILATQDGGQNWIKQKSGILATLCSVHFLNADTGWAVGDERTILATHDGGETWIKHISDSSTSFTSSYFLNTHVGLAMSYDGTILATDDGGRTWRDQTGSLSSSFSTVYFANTDRGWILRRDGTIFVTQDGGKTWMKQLHGTSGLHKLTHYELGYSVNRDGDGAILMTRDQGKTWREVFVYSRAFAPWYYLSLLLLTPLLYLAFKKPKPVEAEQKTVADMLVSDRPIVAGEPDPLEFNAIARGLSRFLRNENTQPPLTIAITGEWGSGKSSLMNLLKADLARDGFRPVWFNAWHHQKEEHLLAALLQNIRKQAVPRLWHRGGIAFRGRLLWGRIHRYWLLALLLLGLFSISAAYFVADTDRIGQAWDKAAEFEKDTFGFFFGEKSQKESTKTQVAKAEVDSLLIVKEGEGWRAILKKDLAAHWKDSSSNDEGEKREERISFWTFVVSTFGLLFVLWRWLRAFGVDPASLMASISDKARMRDLKAQMGFRHDFAREFSEVTAALNPRTMLVLIDDLDRCRPENVLEVLEAVNFLVSSGDCFVVMGLDLTRVERCVGLGFKDVAEELIDDPKEEASKDGGKARREKFARQYLEKLINIEVPVPKPQPAQSQSLIVPPESVARKPVTWWQNLLQLSAPKVRTVSPWLLAAAVLFAGFWFGSKQFSPQATTPNETTVAQTTQPTPSTNQPTPSTTTAQPTRRDAPADSSRGTGELIQPEKEPASFAFVYVALALMIALGIWRLSIPTDLVVKDSPEFIDALKIWHPVLIAKRNTPRSVKRFVNRVRYFAMRQSAETEAQSVWQKLLAWAGMKQKEEAKKDEAVPESILVALSAIQHFEPEWMNKAGSIYAVGEGFQIGPEGMIEEAHLQSKMAGAGAMYEAIKNHSERFDNWPPSEEDRKRLEKLSTGIRIN